MPTLSLKPYSGIFSSALGSCRAVPSRFNKNTDASTLGEIGYICTANIKRVSNVGYKHEMEKENEKVKI